MSWKKSHLVTCKVLTLFINTDDKYSLLSRDNLMQQIQMHLSQNQKFFSQLLCAIFKCPLNFQHFLAKMTLIAFVFPKSRTPENVVR